MQPPPPSPPPPVYPNFPRCGRVRVWRGRELKKDVMHCNWVKDFFTHMVGSRCLWVVCNPLKSVFKPANHESTVNKVAARFTWFRVLHEHPFGLIHLIHGVIRLCSPSPSDCLLPIQPRCIMWDLRVIKGLKSSSAVVFMDVVVTSNCGNYPFKLLCLVYELWMISLLLSVFPSISSGLCRLAPPCIYRMCKNCLHV